MSVPTVSYGQCCPLIPRTIFLTLLIPPSYCVYDTGHCSLTSWQTNRALLPCIIRGRNCSLLNLITWALPLLSISRRTGDANRPRMQQAVDVIYRSFAPSGRCRQSLPLIAWDISRLYSYNVHRSLDCMDDNAPPAVAPYVQGSFSVLYII